MNFSLLATRLQGITVSMTANAGQPLTVTRPATTQGGTATTSTVNFLPQPLNVTQAGNLNLEAGYNVGEENAYDFEAAGNVDVIENDRITYDGFNWRVVNANKPPLSGTKVTLHCYAIREKAV